MNVSIDMLFNGNICKNTHIKYILCCTTLEKGSQSKLEKKLTFTTKNNRRKMKASSLPVCFSLECNEVNQFVYDVYNPL